MEDAVGSKAGPFRVIIAGGGVAGLALANALQYSRIDYVLLERGSDVAPQSGASVGVNPIGWRVLDQLGVYEKLIQLIEPITWIASRLANGDDLVPLGDQFQLFHAR